MNEEKLYFDESARLNFVVWGDPQTSSVNPMREKRFINACKDIAGANAKADALVMVGDIAEYGKESEYKATADALFLAKDKFEKFICVPGNHDIRLRNYKKQIERFQRFMKKVKPCEELVKGRYYYSCEIKGYKFIMLGSDRASFESAYIGEKQLSFLEKEIQKSNNKPVFVFNHQPLKKTNGLPDTWLGKGNWRGSVGKQSEKIQAVLEKGDNVFFITGHLHFGTNKFTYEEKGKLKLLSVPTVGAACHGDYTEDGQGFVVSVYEDKVVLRSREFSNGRYTPSYIPNSLVEIPLDVKQYS